MRRIFAQSRKELTQIVRDRLRAGPGARAAPLMLLFSATPSRSPSMNCPSSCRIFDDSSGLRNFIDAFRASITFHVVAWPRRSKSAEAALSAERAPAASSSSRRHFGRDLARGINTPVQLLVDAHRRQHRQARRRATPGEIARLQPANRQRGPCRARQRRRCACGSTPAAPRRSSTAPASLCSAISMFPPLLAASPCPKKASRRPSSRSMSPASPRTNSCSARSSPSWLIALGEWMPRHVSSSSRISACARRRPHALPRRHRSLYLLRGQLRHHGRRSHPQSGRRHASRGAGRIPARFPALGTDISGPEYSGRLALGLQHRLGPLLHRDRARRAACRAAAGPPCGSTSS